MTNGAGMRGEHCHGGAGGRPALGPEIEAEEAHRVCRGLVGPGLVTLDAILSTLPSIALWHVCHSTNIFAVFTVVVAELF